MAGLFLALVLETGSVHDGKGGGVEAEKGHGESRAQAGATANLGRVSQLAEGWGHLGVLINAPHPAPQTLCPPRLGAPASAESLRETECSTALLGTKRGSSLSGFERSQPGLKLLSIISDPEPIVYLTVTRL